MGHLAAAIFLRVHDSRQARLGAGIGDVKPEVVCARLDMSRMVSALPARRDAAW
jgi:hypothetical protein